VDCGELSDWKDNSNSYVESQWHILPVYITKSEKKKYRNIINHTQLPMRVTNLALQWNLPERTL